jgi:hydrogenase-4 component F
MINWPWDPLVVVIASPAVAAAVLAVMPGYRVTASLNVVASLVTLVAAASLFIARPHEHPYLLLDDLNIVFIALNAFVGFTTSVFSAGYIGHEIEIGRLTPAYVRFYHALFQVMMFGMNLALVADNIGLMWVAIELATLTTVVMVGLYRTHEAIEAAWKYFILGSVGIALALFGTILVYMAAEPVVGEGLNGMVWTVLIQNASKFDPALLNVAFVFLLLGYGTKVGLAPLHAWLPDAHAEGPTPISAVLSGLLLNVALYAVLRFKLLLAANPAAIAPGPLMALLGLVSLVFAAFMLYRRRDIKRLFAYSSIEHMGVIAFAFGMGGPIANFAGLLHMTMHSLTKSAIFYVVGRVAQVKGTQRIAEIRGLTESHPLLGWTLVASVAAIVGLPPSGVFMSEFLIASSTFARQPILALIFVAGLLIAFGALIWFLQGFAFGEPTGSRAPVQGSFLPIFAHLGIVVTAGLFIPPAVLLWFGAVACKLETDPNVGACLATVFHLPPQDVAQRLVEPIAQPLALGPG